LTGWIYKVIAKVLAYRLKKVVGTIISERQILDGILIADIFKVEISD